MLPLLAVVGALAALASAQNECPAGAPPFVPSAFPPDLTTFDYNEAGLQLFTHLEITCDGVISEWRYLLHKNKAALVGAHFAVFRPIGEGRFVQVGETYIANEPAVGDWASHQLDLPIAVIKGDVIGLYYDDLAMAALATEPHATGKPTFVWVNNAQHVINSNYIVDASQAIADERIPALVAVLAPRPTTTESTPTTPPQTSPTWPTWPTWPSSSSTPETPATTSDGTTRWWWTFPTINTAPPKLPNFSTMKPRQMFPNLPGLFGIPMQAGSGSRFPRLPGGSQRFPDMAPATRFPNLAPQPSRPAFLGPQPSIPPFFNRFPVRPLPAMPKFGQQPESSQ